jgi:hypothetical protein
MPPPTRWRPSSPRGISATGDEAEARAITALDAEVAAGVAWDDTTYSLNTAQAGVRRQVRQYRRQVAPEITPVAVEGRLSADLEPGVVVSGEVDCRETNGLIDLKTGTARRANAVQYGTYALIHRAHRLPVERLREVFLPRVRAADEISA